jgi:hypothetical protein
MSLPGPKRSELLGKVMKHFDDANSLHHNETAVVLHTNRGGAGRLPSMRQEIPESLWTLDFKGAPVLFRRF